MMGRFRLAFLIIIGAFQPMTPSVLHAPMIPKIINQPYHRQRGAKKTRHQEFPPSQDKGANIRSHFVLSGKTL